MDNGYEAQRREGNRHEDHVAAEVFWKKLNIPLMNYSSRELQMHGENMQGVEIKLDKKFRFTGNLYIEVAEKRSCANENYVPSGICKDSDDWLFAVGDYDTTFIFARSLLLNWYRKKQYHIVTTPTSIGMLLPLAVARRWAAKIVSMNNTTENDNEYGAFQI